MEEHSERLCSQTHDFERSQVDIDRRLAATQTDAAPAAAAHIAACIEKLRRLDVAQGYVELLLQVQDLAAEARRHIVADPREALKPYTKLQLLSHDLHARNRAIAEEPAVHLVDYVERSTGALWVEMKSKLSAQLEEALDKMKWPKPDAVPDAAFQAAFDKLLVLQGPELDSEEGKTKTLLAFEVLVRPMGLRFRYHFEGDRATNKIDKPEWFLSHLTSLVSSYVPFLMNTVQPILSASDSAAAPRNATTEFITALLPMLRRKIQRLMPQLVNQPQLLSHFIHELIKFDAELRSDFLYCPHECEGDIWKGVTHEVLVVEGGFNKWLTVEKEFALSRYHTILTGEDAWTLDYDSVQAHETKPTRSALRLKDLLEAVTDTYRPLLSFSQRLRFLIDIQIAVLDMYHDRLNSSLEALLTLSSSIARAVQGTSRDEAQSLSGVAGLERLCRVYGSAVFMEACMRDWGEDIFFLELWEELQERAHKSHAASTNALTTTMDVRAVASVTSATIINSTDPHHHDDDDEGALFDETAAAYRRLRARAEHMISELVLGELRDALKPYTRLALWASTSPTISSDVIAVSPEIDAPATTLNAHLAFLKRALSPLGLARVYRDVLAGAQTLLWERVLMAHQFSHAGGVQLSRDVAELCSVGARYVDHPVAPARRLHEACRLLALPSQADGERNEDEEEKGEEKEKVLLLGEIAKDLFDDGEKARAMLQRLGVETLSTKDARAVLQRRIDTWA